MTIYIVLAVAAIGVGVAVPLTKRLDREWEKRHETHNKRNTSAG